MSIGVNTFGLKRVLYENFDETLAQIKECGFYSLEPCILLSKLPINSIKKALPKEMQIMAGGIWPMETAAKRIAEARSKGLEIYSVHLILMNANIKTLERFVPKLIQFAHENGIKYYVLSLCLDFDTAEKSVNKLQTIAEKMKSEGIILCYHNHEHESRYKGGQTVLDYILEHCASMQIQLDVGWMKFAGEDAIAFMDKYRTRIELLHLKDIRENAAEETRDTCYTAIGEGSIPLKEILKMAKEIGLSQQKLIIDQDDSQDDMIDDLRRGYINICSNYENEY